jgi:hypothetical protein
VKPQIVERTVAYIGYLTIETLRIILADGYVGVAGCGGTR